MIWVKQIKNFAAEVLAAVAARLLPSGGAANQVLAKTDGTDYAVGWTDQATAQPLNAWGDIATTASISNSTTETNIATCTIPGYTLYANADMVEFISIGTLLNNTGANRTITIALKLFTSTIYISDTSINIPTSSTSRVLICKGELIYNAGYLHAVLSIYLSGAGTATTWTGDFGTSALLIATAFAYNISLGTGESDLPFSIALQLSTASTNYIYTPAQTVLKKIGSSQNILSKTMASGSALQALPSPPILSRKKAILYVFFRLQPITIIQEVTVPLPFLPISRGIEY
jgi:hypothetical protein